MFNRRKFIKALSYFSLVPTLGKAQDAISFNFEQGSLRVLQSATLDSSTLITVLVHKKSDLEITVKPQMNQLVPILKVEKVDLNLGEFVVYQVHISQLETRANYRLEIYDHTYSRLTVKNFKSLDTSNPNVKIAFMTCSSHRNADPQSVMCEKIKISQPDVILFPGDLVYANSALDTVLGRPATPQEAYAVYCKTFFEIDFYNFDDLIPVFTSWDDHDLAFNNSDTTHPNKEIMLKMFRTFYPVDSRVQGITTGPGISYCFEAFGAQFLFLDVRFFFDKKNKFFLGSEQYNWLLNNCKESDNPKFLISAVQFWNYGKLAECFEKDGSSEFSKLLNFLKSLSQPVLFLTGDVHYSQIQRLDPSYLGYLTYEISSSALFSLSSRSYGKRSVDKGQLHHYGLPNFLILDQFSINSRKVDFSVRCITEKSDLEFKMDLEISK